MKLINKNMLFVFLFAVLATGLFGTSPKVYAGNQYTNGAVIPNEVKREIIRGERCTLGQGSRHFTTVWVSTKENGDGLLFGYGGTGRGSGYSATARADRDTKIYINYGALNCNGSQGDAGALNNIKAIKRTGSTNPSHWNTFISKGFNVSGNSYLDTNLSFGGWGEGSGVSYTAGDRGVLERVYRMPIIIKGSEVSKLGAGIKNISFVLDHCISRYRMNALDNFEHSVLEDQTYRRLGYTVCMNVQVTIRVNVVNLPPPDIKDTMSYSSNPSSQIKNNTNQTTWTNNTINVPVGGKAYFKHSINGNFNSNYSDYFLNWSHHTSLRSPRATNKREFGPARQRSNPLVYFEDSPNAGITAQKSHLGQLSCESISYNWSLAYHYMKGIVTSDGRQAHQRTRDTTKDANGSKASRPACFYTPYNYELVPCVKSGGSGCGDRDIPAEPGQSVPLDPVVTGGTPRKSGTIYKLTKWRIGGDREGDPETPNKEIVGSSDGNTCSIYNSSEMFKGAILARTCSVEEQMDNDKFNNPFPTVPEDAKIGERFCAALSVSPYLMKPEENKQQQENNSLWRHSRPICIIVVKKPKMQIWNGGVSSQNGIQTSRTVIEGDTFGSWVEYSAISNAEIKNFGSGASANNMGLSFANAQSGAVGSFGQPSIGGRIDRLIQSIKSKFGTKNNDGSDGKGVMVSNNESSAILNLGSYGHLRENLNTSVIYGKKINIHGDREIKNIGQQMIIVADEIYIHPSVKRIDAWLIARDKVVTCAEADDSTLTLKDNSKAVNDKTCGNKLEINGAVLTRHLKSFRTHGRISTDDPAEIYNQRPDMYFWGIHNSNSSNNIKTTYTKELPVRY